MGSAFHIASNEASAGLLASMDARSVADASGDIALRQSTGQSSVGAANRSFYAPVRAPMLAVSGSGGAGDGLTVFMVGLSQ